MEIEIVTTKKKLTKSLIKQFDKATFEMMQRQVDNSILDNSGVYRIVGVYKYDIAIFEVKGSWLYYPLLSHTHRGDTVYRGNQRYDFKSKEAAQCAVKSYEKLKLLALKIFI